MGGSTGATESKILLTQGEYIVGQSPCLQLGKEAPHRPRVLGRHTSGALAVVAALGLPGCGSGTSSICLTNDFGEVCADGSDGPVKFSGSVLTPGSDALIDHQEMGMSTYQVGADGSFDPDIRGVVSVFADTEFTFMISATDADGDLFEGEISVET